MKFIHIADVHFDKPLTVLEKNGLAEVRRLEQRRAFHELIEYIKKNDVSYLFIAGDLYEHEYIRRSTIEYINDCFKEIENTTIYITPGNHDPYLENSYYQQFHWNQNVHIIKGQETIENKDFTLYGYGFTDFYSESITLPKILDKNKINILLMHADVNGSTKSVGEYNPILESTLKNSEFDYVALGHIHKQDRNNVKMVYPGSMFAGGFDELGTHGMIEGNISDETKEVKIYYRELDHQEFIKQEINIENIVSKEELIETINVRTRENNKYYEYILIGNRQIEIDTNELLKYIEDKSVIKIKDNTMLPYDLKKIAEESSLKGIFVKEMLSKIKEDESNKEAILKMIGIGLDAM